MRIRNPIVFAATLLFVPAIASQGLADTGYTVTVNATQEVPVNASAAIGSGTLIVNLAQTQVTYNITYSGLSSNRTAQHIHGPAGASANAGVLVPLSATGNRSGTISGIAPITSLIAGYMATGQTYVNIHTSGLPGGEIRGQVAADVTPTQLTTWGRIKKLYR